MKDLLEYNFPTELKNMNTEEMQVLADQIREFLIDKVSKTGGHLASNMGVVELTLALHKVFDSPEDRILWDVGHQSYVHKILTGRAGEFDTLRQYGGLSGFPKRAESPADVYDAGHSSDSISVALGIAKARDMDQKDYHVVTVIGDGALTGGVAFEALNNAGASKSKMIIIINDNQMSISPNVGGLTQHLSRLRLSPAYVNMKKRIRAGLTSKGPAGKKVFHGMEAARNRVKGALIQTSVFENLGFKFYGPVDGHDIEELVDFLEAVKQIDGPVILHVMTRKGKGNEIIEKNADRFHGIGPFDPKTMEPVSAASYASWS
ncbi:MAG: 1-deoxy-D-xylulose-5-phosphate synthase, partial [Firmicutes bacterium]|nr:1-deoxy-D-xylulose-5-phosphate synthase [Bacillota bacterium]